jgi:competence protein ComEA
MAVEEIDFSSVESSDGEEGNKFEHFILRNKVPVALGLMGLILIGLGVFVVRNGQDTKENNIEVLNASTESQGNEIIVEVAGEVTKPGVYSFKDGDRIDDALDMSGGLTEEADIVWVEKTINKAALLTDGQKIYIPSVNSQKSILSGNSDSVYQNGSSTDSVNMQGMVNINTSSQSDLETLNGIGPVYATSIIESRPYSNIEELVSKKIIPQKTFDKIKDKISVY